MARKKSKADREFEKALRRKAVTEPTKEDTHVGNAPAVGGKFKGTFTERRALLSQIIDPRKRDATSLSTVTPEIVARLNAQPSSTRTIPTRSDIAAATKEIRDAFKNLATAPAAPAMPPAAAPHVGPPMPLEREGVPSPQSLTQRDYEAKYGTARDVSPAAPRDYGIILKGPTALNHEGRLRRTGKVSGHWAMYAYLVNVGPIPALGIQFKSGFRCWYPGTSEEDYHAIVNAESGSYYVHDHLLGAPYTSF